MVEGNVVNRTEHVFTPFLSEVCTFAMDNIKILAKTCFLGSWYVGKRLRCWRLEPQPSLRTIIASRSLILFSINISI
uniref:Uncharacterized protein n=1 Tax=Bursaphelenchus xylophilus TaxID=6326 RepID=A0A1I7SK51_BURXY